MLQADAIPDARFFPMVRLDLLPQLRNILDKHKMQDRVTGGSWSNVCRQTSSAEASPPFARGLYCFTQLAVTRYTITSPKLFPLKCGRLIRMAAARAAWYHQGDVDFWETQRSGRLFSPSIIFLKKQNGRTPSEAAGHGAPAGLQRARHVAAVTVGPGEIAPSSICFDHVTTERAAQATGAKFDSLTAPLSS